MYFLWQDLSHGTIFFYLVTLTLNFDLLLKNFNLGHNFLTRRDRAFILHICISCDKTFHMVPLFLTLWPWPWRLTYFWNTLPLAITFLQEEIGLSFCTCIFRVTRPFTLWSYFWPRDIDFEVLPTLKNFNHGFYLVMVAARRAWLSSDNSYCDYMIWIAFASLSKKHYFINLTGIAN